MSLNILFTKNLHIKFAQIKVSKTTKSWKNIRTYSQNLDESIKCGIIISVINF